MSAPSSCPCCPPLQVTFYGCVLDGPKGILLMELMDGRDLGSVLRLRNAQGQRVFGWYKHGCRVAWEVAKALNYLHARNFVHMVSAGVGLAKGGPRPAGAAAANCPQIPSAHTHCCWWTDSHTPCALGYRTSRPATCC